MQVNNFDPSEHGNREHSHMLGCGVAWFSGKYPDEWSKVKALPAEAAFEKMLETMKPNS